MTDVRLALGGSPEIVATGFMERPPEELPAILVSYVWLDEFRKHRHRFHFRDWVLDSGAFSAHVRDIEIKLEDYIETAKEFLGSDDTLKEVFALDVISDWKESLKNYEAMWEAGVPAVPTYHVGEPEHVLRTLAREYPKIAISGSGTKMYSRKERGRLFAQCFERVWPKRIHLFATLDKAILETLPVHSADSSSWALNAAGYGWWKGFGLQRLRQRGVSPHLQTEVDWYIKYERRLKAKWGSVLEDVSQQDPVEAYKEKLEHVPYEVRL